MIKKLLVILFAIGLVTGCGSSSAPAPGDSADNASAGQINNDPDSSQNSESQNSQGDSDPMVPVQDPPGSNADSALQNDTIADTTGEPTTVLPETEAVDVNNTSGGVPEPGQYCQATTASVVYEPFFSASQGSNSLGRYVPVPATGFGWANGQLCELSASFGVDQIESIIPFVRNRPDTDGVTTNAEWSMAAIASQVDYVTSRNDIDNLLLSPVPDYLDGSGYSRWRAMHDGTNLYLHIYVSSDGANSIYTDSDNPWHDDSIELFIDGDNSKGTEYDGVNDFQVTLLARSDNWQPAISGFSPDNLGIYYRASASRGRVEYEVSINLESAGIQIGSPFGFDVHINEDDNGGDRDAKWGWYEKTGNDRSWHNPSVLGTAVLTDCDDRNACGSYQVLVK